MRSFTKQNMRRFAGSNYISYREGSLSAVEKQQRSAGQLPDVRQLHLLKLAHLLPQILVLQHREQPRINRREICRTGNQELTLGILQSHLCIITCLSFWVGCSRIASLPSGPRECCGRAGDRLSWRMRRAKPRTSKEAIASQARQLA